MVNRRLKTGISKTWYCLWELGRGIHCIQNKGSKVQCVCFPGIKTEQLHRIVQKRDLGSSETVIVHMGMNDLRTTRNLDFLYGRSIFFVGYGKEEIPNC